MTPRPDRARLLAIEACRAARRPASRRCLLLDLDGTLAPLELRPEQARVPRESLEAIRRLRGRGWTIAIVSGRPAAAARRMVPIRGIRVFGSHGLEGSWSGSGKRRIPASLRNRLAGLLRAGRRAARGIPGALVESKPAGVGFHDRRVPGSHLRLWRHRVREVLEGQDLEGLEILEGKRVVEIRPVGCSKGSVVQGSPGFRPGSGRDESFLALGDDRTDEDMFRAIRGAGLGVRVGPPGRPSAALRRLASPGQVGRFLELLSRDFPS